MLPKIFYARLLFYTYYKISSFCYTLLIEKGRYHNIERGKRICQICDMNDVEDEYHFIFKCPFYTNLRHLYIKKYYLSKPSVFKLVQLLSVQKRKELCNIGKYLKHALYIRNCPSSMFFLTTCHHFYVLNVCTNANEPKGLKLINKQTNLINTLSYMVS